MRSWRIPRRRYRFLTIDDIETVVANLIQDLLPSYPEPAPDFQYLGGEQGKGLLESSLAQPQQSFGGQYLYRTTFDKAAVLMCSIIKNHPFLDGNKRMGLTSAAVFLSLNDYWFAPPPNPDEVVDICVRIAQSPIAEGQKLAARWLRANSISLRKFRSLTRSERRRRLLGVVYLAGAVKVMLRELEKLQRETELLR